jgi:LacI family transcriptional regulator
MAGRTKTTSERGAPTSADVARIAGVSKATISLVLNGGASKVRISDETRDKVLAVAADLGYRPNHAARSLRQRRSRTIAMVLPSLANPYFAEVVLGAQATAREAGYTVTVLVSDRVPEGLAALEGSAFDGVIVSGRLNVAAPTIRQIASHGVPVVALQQASPDPSILSVRVDLEAGGHLATTHLIGLGHRRIAHITEPRPESPTTPDRADGYRRALAEAGIAYDPSLVIVTENTMDGGAQAVDRLFDAGALAGPPPTAIFSYNDVMAVGALAGLRRRGLSVPGDVALVGFDGITLGAFVAPTLTTIDHPRGQLGRVAVTAVIDAIEQRAPTPPATPLPVSLIVRESCGGRRPA